LGTAMYFLNIAMSQAMHFLGEMLALLLALLADILQILGLIFVFSLLFKLWGELGKKLHPNYWVGFVLAAGLCAVFNVTLYFLLNLVSITLW